MTEPIITVRDLTRSFSGRPVLRGLDLDVRPGEILGLIGRNGAGKTTAVEIMQGIGRADGGVVEVAGIDPARDRGRLRGVIGSQLQDCGLPDRIRVDEALRLFAGLAGDVVDWRALRAEWDLDGLGRRQFGALSGGERQRVFIALALVNRPQVVFLDELTQNLDPAARNETWRLVRRVRDEGATIVLVTHDLEEAEHLCDRVAVLAGGRIRSVGTPAELASGVGAGVQVRFSVAAGSAATLEQVRGVTSSTHDGTTLTLVCSSDAVFRVVRELDRQGLAPADFAVHPPGLHDVFGTLTTDESSEPTVAARAVA